MALYFHTKSPDALLGAFEARVGQSEPRGRINVWRKSDDGQRFTHTAPEWTEKAWLKARVEDDKLVFNIIRPHDRYVSVWGYAFFYGQLIETFTNHLDLNFDRVTVTPRCADGDLWA